MTTSLSKVRVAVLGVGSLGKEHARIYSELASAGQVEFAGVYDVSDGLGAEVRRRNTRCAPLLRMAEAAAAADALNIVTPTTTHYDIAKALLGDGKHVLVEKPMTDSSAQAADLVQLALQKNCVLQVGHVERFNPIFKYLETAATHPRFIETHRLSPYPARSTDIGVVLDLMIHDLDVVLAFVKSPVTSVDAVGIPVLSKSEDIANARLAFCEWLRGEPDGEPREPGAHAKNPRVQRRRYAELYLARLSRAGRIYLSHRARWRRGKFAVEKAAWRAKDSTIVSEFGGKRIVREPVPIAKEEPLKLELQHFVECVREKQTPMVSGESAKQALDLAFEITRLAQA